MYTLEFKDAPFTCPTEDMWIDKQQKLPLLDWSYSMQGFVITRQESPIGYFVVLLFSLSYFLDWARQHDKNTSYHTEKTMAATLHACMLFESDLPWTAGWQVLTRTDGKQFLSDRAYSAYKWSQKRTNQISLEPVSWLQKYNRWTSRRWWPPKFIFN